MSDVVKGIILIAAGALIGLVAFGDVSTSSDAAQPPQTGKAHSQAPPASPSVAPTPRDVESERGGKVELSARTSGALGSRQLAYAHFTLEAGESDATDVRLAIAPDRGVRISHVYGPSWERDGRGAIVEFDAIRANDLGATIVELELDGASTVSLDTQLSYREFSSGTAKDVVGQAKSIDVATRSTDAQVLLSVRQEETREVLGEAEELLRAKKYKEAKRLVVSARAANLDVGLSHRVSRDLEPEQARLEALSDRIAEASKPKPRPKRPAPKKIDIMGVADS